MLNILIKTSKKNKLYHYCYQNNINIYTINENNDYLNLLINEKDFPKLNKLWYIKIINHQYKGAKKYLHNKKVLLPSIIFIITFLFTITFFNNYIIKVEILSTNKELRDLLKVSLEEHDIKKNTYKKNYQELKKIKEKIIEEYKDRLEWLEIETKGMTYIIRLEERKKEEPKENDSYCDIIAKKDGIIKRQIYEEGTSLHEINDYVHKNDILISGDITKDNNIVKTVCAKGNVYAEVWYIVSVSIPKEKKERIRTDKIRYNIKLINNHFNDYIFKNRLKEYDEVVSSSLTIFNTKILLIKQIDVTYNITNYTEEEITSLAIESAKNKILAKLNKEEEIIYQKVLKKEENNSTMDIEVFTSVIEQIGVVKKKE